MSDTKTTRQSLFDDFPPVSKEEWEKAISEDLNGADIEKLRWETGEGIEPLPFYRREDLSEIDRVNPIPKNYTDGSANAWEIREPIFAKSIEAANKSSTEALKRGADALQFYLRVRRTEGMLGGDLEGLPVQDQQSFHKLLHNISVEDTALHFDAGLASPTLLAMLRNETEKQDAEPDQVEATFLYDPFIYVLLNGQQPKEKKELEHDITQLVQFTNRHLPAVRPLGIDARTFHNTGGSILQELAFAMSGTSEYLATLTDNGFDIDEVTNSLHFSFAIGSNYFLEIAKFRAVRLLWKNLIEAYGGNSTNNMYIHAETSEWNKTQYDPYTNMLRTSTEGMSGAVAGCDSLTILPFDQHFRQPDNFSRRIARNQQLILSEEAFLDKVEDPGAGSYYIEKLTEEIGRQAWQLFQEIETEGGLMQAIENGTVQSAIEDSKESRDQAIATQKHIFVGTNQYSNPDETMADELESSYQTISLMKSEEEEFSIEKFPEDLADAFAKGATMGDVAPYLFDFGKHYIRAVSPYRGSQAFEQLRMATEKHGTTPKVLTLPLGNRKMRKARSAFTSNFFGSVGYKIEDPMGFEDVDAAIDTVKKLNPDIAVICSSDEEYKELVPAIGEAFSEMEKAPILVLAGYPDEEAKSYKEAGVEEFIYANCDVLETLRRFQTKLEIIEPG